MTALPVRSSGVRAAPLGNDLVLHDGATAMVHVVNATGAVVWQACDGQTPASELVADLAAASGADASLVQIEVVRCVEDFAAAGLVGRQGPVADPEPGTIGTAQHGAYVGAVHYVGIERVQFTSDDADLLAAVDHLLGPLAGPSGPTVSLRLDRGSHGVVLVGQGAEQRFSSAAEFLDHAPSVLNRVAATTRLCLSLHAGAVRSPAGSSVVLPAVSGGGKSTLTAALVLHGWDYITDEAVGVLASPLAVIGYPKPLALDPTSRAALGLAPEARPYARPADLRDDVAVVRGRVAPATVVLPAYEPGCQASSEHLAPGAAVSAIAEHALNLVAAGQTGLDALVALAAGVPVLRLHHGGGHEAVAAVAEIVQIADAGSDGGGAIEGPRGRSAASTHM